MHFLFAIDRRTPNDLAAIRRFLAGVPFDGDGAFLPRAAEAADQHRGVTAVFLLSPAPERRLRTFADALTERGVYAVIAGEGAL